MTPDDDLREKLLWFLTTEPGAPHPTMGAEEGDAPAAVGRKLGRYRLTGLLGEGGMGVVYHAVDDELGREVAIKLLKAGSAFSPTQIERFLREARHTARLRHPGIATLYEIGREGDVHFLALEHIKGKSFDPTSGDLRERIVLLEKVARAVQFAHEQGVLHRDLKPGNILVDEKGEPRLLDFGLSREIEDGGDLTRDGAFFGTPSYAAPEQAEGRVKEIDVRTDVYALGAVLYEIITGSVPATGNTLAEILQKVSTEEPVPPKGPPDLTAVCLKALEKDPARRYPTAGAFADDLARHLQGEAVMARRASPPERAWRVLRRRRAIAIPAALALLLAVVAAAWIQREIAQSAERRLHLDDFEREPQGWTAIDGMEYPGAKVWLDIDDIEAHRGRRSYRCRFDLTEGGYVGGWRRLPDFDGWDAREFRFWVKAPGLHRLMIRLADSTEQIHQYHVRLSATPDWQEVVVKRNEVVGGERWGGADDGRWHGPARAIGIHVGKEEFAEGARRVGAFWVDDLEAILIRP